MIIRDLKGDQRRQLIDAQQVYQAWRETDQELRHRFAGSMRWAERNGTEYLLHKIKNRETSLGPRSKETEKTWKSFIHGRETAREKLAGLSQRLDDMAPVNRAMGLGRVPVIAARILRKCDEKAILGNQILVIGTNALFAYEALAGVQITPALIASGDIDLLHDTRRRLSLAVAEDLKEKGLIGLLQKTDRSFAAARSSYQAVNRDGYYVDLVRAESNNVLHETSSKKLTEHPEDMESVAIAGLEWLINAPKMEAVALDERGYPVRMVVVDPRAYALHKIWLSEREDRNRLKYVRDREQAKVAARISTRYLNLGFESKELTALPSSLLKAVPALLDGIKEKSSTKKTEPDW